MKTFLSYLTHYQKSTLVLVLLMGSILLPFTAHAAIYMRVTDIPGDATAAGYEEWIVVNNTQYSVSTTVDWSGGGGATTRPQLTDISVSKLLDIATIALLAKATDGRLIPEVDIVITMTCGEDTTDFFNVNLRDVVITGISHSVDGSTTPAESLTMAYREIRWTYTPRRADCSPLGSITAGYDVSTGSPL